MPSKAKAAFLKEQIEHFDIKKHNAVGIIEAMSKMAYSSRDLARAAEIYDRMIADKDCAIFFCLAGSLVSAGLRKAVYDLVANNMIDAIVSTGANIVDQDFFEALGFKHYKGTKWVDDHALRRARVDRIYDTFIDEDELGACDKTLSAIAGELDPRPYSSREFIDEMGRFLVENRKGSDSIVRVCHEKSVPIFVPAFSDCSAGFGLLHHQWNHPDRHVSLDSARDFLELVKLKLACKQTGLLMLGGGVPKNFAQDMTVGPEMLGLETVMHRYAIQITVADERDGALSGSTLREAASWGKVDTAYEQMVYAEASLAFPLLASYGYHKGSWKNRKARGLGTVLKTELASSQR